MLNEELLSDDVSVHLKENIASGNQQAFKQLYQQFSKRLIYFARSIVKNEDAAFEIIDDVFIKVWRNKENICDIKNLKVYLYKAVKNTALNYIAQHANKNITDPFDFIDIQLKDELSPEQQLISREIHLKIDTAVNCLPPRCKMVFKLVREDGLKYKEVAEILNISENTVDAQMVIAVQRISQAVRSEFSFFPSKLRKV